MEEHKIIYKRNSAWWIATCYLLGTLFLIIYAVISLLGLFTNIGISGFQALAESSENSKLMRSLAARIKDDVQLVGYKVEKGGGNNYLTISIKNNSAFSVGSFHVEIAALDAQGLPSYARNEWLHDLQMLFPGDTAHAKVELPKSDHNQNFEYTVRISDFNVLGEQTLNEYCKTEMSIIKDST